MSDKPRPWSRFISRYQLIRMIADLRGTLYQVLRDPLDPEEQAQDILRVLDVTAFNTSPADEHALDRGAPPLVPRRHRLPDERKSLTHEFHLRTMEVQRGGKDVVEREYTIKFTVGFYPNGDLGEIFFDPDEIGDGTGIGLDALMTMTSVGLQCGMPISVFVDKFKMWSFEPSGKTDNPQIPECVSILAYVARWLELKFMDESS